MATFLQAVFFVVAIAGGAYFLVRRRTFDFFTIGFASSVVYFLPGFFGFVRSSRDFTLPEPLLPETYLVFLAVLLSILLGGMIFDHFLGNARVKLKRHIPLTLTTEMALAIALFSLFATLLTSGSDLFSPHKEDVLAATGRWHVLFQFGAIYLFAFAVLQRRAAFATMGVLLLLFDLYVGFRIGLVIGVLSVVTIHLNRQGPRSLIRSERKAIVAGILLVAAVLVYKRIYTVVKLGLWDTVMARLTDPEILFLALMTSEPFGTQSVLNEVIRTGFFTGPEHLASVASLLVPFSNLLGAEATLFNNLFQERLFGGVVLGGLAANIWAQMYAVAGWLGIGIGIPVYVGVLALGSRVLDGSRSSLAALVAVAFTFFAFYIHRNDVFYILVLLRRCLMFWLLCVVPGMFFVDVARWRSRQNAIST